MSPEQINDLQKEFINKEMSNSISSPNDDNVDVMDQTMP